MPLQGPPRQHTRSWGALHWEGDTSGAPLTRAISSVGADLSSAWRDPQILGFLHFLHFFAGMKAEIFLGLLVILSLFQASVSSSYGIVLFSGFADQGLF